ncbi:MAG: hypothetical protein IJ671_06660 [Succinivibrio sp.]|nr:hypothetical protein [Succinivibrio sp.]
MIDITASQYIFSVIGVTLLGLGVISIFVPRHFRLGVLIILLADLFFAIAIVFPKKAAELFVSMGASERFLASEPLISSIIEGIVIYALIYVVYFPVKKHIFRSGIEKQPDKAKTAAKKEKAENSAKKEAKAPEKTVLAEEISKEKATEKTAKASLGENKADPRIFEKLRAR